MGERRTMRLGATRRRRQLALGDLVQQRLVADLEDAGGLGAIPPHALEHLDQGLALGLTRTAPRDLTQSFGRVPGRQRDRVPVAVGVAVAVPIPTASGEGLERRL